MLKKSKKLLSFITPGWTVGFVIFLVAIVVYVLTLAPGIYLEDSAEFITASIILGIPHPSGYPLYVILGKIFSLLPFGELAWRVNLMSAFFGALAAALVGFIVFKLTRHWVISIAAGLILAFSRTFWSQSVVAEVYTLHIFLFLALFLIWLRLRESSNEKYVYWLAILSGLAVGNHLLTLLYLPIYFVYLLKNKKMFSNFIRVFLIGVILFLVGLTVYLYLPFRSLQNPALDWGNPETLQNFWAHVSRAQYADVNLSGTGNKLLLAHTFFTFIADEISWPLFAFSLFGLWWIFKHRENKILGVMTLAIFLSSGLAVIAFRSFGWSFVIEELFKVYYLPALVIVIIWLGLAFNFFWEKVIKKLFSSWTNIFVKNSVVFLLIVFLISIPMALVAGNWQVNNLSDSRFIGNWSERLLVSLRPDSILLLKGTGFSQDTQVFSIAYQQYVKRVRPDILVIDDASVFGLPKEIKLDRSYLLKTFAQQQEILTTGAWQYAKSLGRDFYSNFPADAFIEDIRSYSNGLVYLNLLREEKLEPVSFFSTDDPDETIESRFSGQDYLASYYYTQAAGVLRQIGLVPAQDILIRAIELDNEPFSSEYQNYLKHRQKLAR